MDPCDARRTSAMEFSESEEAYDVEEGGAFSFRQAEIAAAAALAAATSAALGPARVAPPAAAPAPLSSSSDDETRS